MDKFISVASTVLNGNELNYLKQCIESGWISSEGQFVKSFEEKFANLVKRKHAIAVTSGTAALELAASAINLKKGDEVILPTFAIISCIAPLIRLGVIPIFVDSDPFTWNMDVKQIEKKITPSTKAIMVVHTYGLPVDMEPVMNLSKKHGLSIIEDAAEAHGIQYKDLPCGSFGDVSTFSFYSNKLITTGEGGMVLTNDDNIAKECRLLRNLYFKNGDERFMHDGLGWNFRMSNLQAAVGLAQIERIDEFVKKKKFIGKKYTELLTAIDTIQIPVEKTDYAENTYWVYGVVPGESVRYSTKILMKELFKNGIETRPFFWPLHEQPVFNRMGLFNNGKYPVAENLARKGFYIPSGLGLTENEINIVAEKLTSILLS